jgi:hypothetical protein
MNPTFKPSTDLVPAGLPSFFPSLLPLILSRAGSAAVFATEEFFSGRLRNANTRAAYLIAIRRFLKWAESRGLQLQTITPKDVGQYMDGLKDENTSMATASSTWPRCPDGEKIIFSSNPRQRRLLIAF